MFKDEVNLILFPLILLFFKSMWIYLSVYLQDDKDGRIMFTWGQDTCEAEAQNCEYIYSTLCKLSTVAVLGHRG